MKITLATIAAAILVFVGALPAHSEIFKCVDSKGNTVFRDVPCAEVRRPQAKIKAPTYSVVANEVPVRALLYALSRDAKVNMDIHPGLQGVVSINATNKTIPAILDRLSEQIPLHYRMDGDTFIVSPGYR